MSIANENKDEPFRLEAPPNELWSKLRLCQEFGVTGTQLDEMVRSGRVPRHWCRRSNRPYWAPEVVKPALARHRRLTS